MFSAKKSIHFDISAYDCFQDDLHVFYDSVGEFAANLDILVANTNATGKHDFISLAFSFIDKKEEHARGTVRLTITKLDADTISLKVSSTSEKDDYRMSGPGIENIIGEIAKQSSEIGALLTKLYPIINNGNWRPQSKNLLEKFHILTLSISDTNAPNSLKNINHILDVEIADFKNTVELNEINSTSPSPGRW